MSGSPDVEWIEEAAKRGWPVLMKDKRIRYRRAELDAVIEHGARCFVVTRGGLTSIESAGRFIGNEQAIFRAAVATGPFIYAVHVDRIEPLYPC